MNTLVALKPRALRALVLFGVLAVAAVPAYAATITIVNINAAGVGFNDTTPRTPIGGNPGTTLGAQRLYIFNYAAAIWGSVLPSNVTIVVSAQFAGQTCTATSATLGSSGASTIHRDFAGAPFTGTWYNQALANKLSGSDLAPANPDMNSTFNSSIDNGCFGPGFTWYYGVDGNEPATGIELLPVLLHEMGHGLGFQTQTSTNGTYSSGFPTAFDHFLLNKTTGLHWNEGGDTTAARTARRNSAIALNQLVWDGPNSVAFAATFLGGQAQVFVNSPAGIAGMKTAQDATFGATLTTVGLTGVVVQALDPADVAGPTTFDACEPLTNAAAVSGKIALVDRGTCTFVAKALNVQAAGAIGMIVGNNAATGLPGMGGTDPTITIPCVGISQPDATAIRSNLPGVNATIGRSSTVKAGADTSYRALMYTPNPVVAGSSVSHWDISLTPNALMEPNINNDLHLSLDLTLTVMRDIGWFRTNKTVGAK